MPIHRGSWYFACMSRLARMVVPGLPHHMTQRGNRREAIFFEDGDQHLYWEMLAEQLRKFSVEVWTYCLMPSHLHLILAPRGTAGMSRPLGEAHRRYTNFIHASGRWTGPLYVWGDRSFHDWPWWRSIARMYLE
jgi:putative transposase